MTPNKLKVSLAVTVILALGLVSLSFFRASDTPVIQDFSGVVLQKQASLIIDFGDGDVKNFELEPRGENLFTLTKNKLSDENINIDYETYPSLGELITQIGDKENGDSGKYWQFWINGEYSQVGVSSYIPRAGDMIEWKFTNEEQ